MEILASLHNSMGPRIYLLIIFLLEKCYLIRKPVLVFSLECFGKQNY